MSILIVDDSQTSRVILENALRKAGHCDIVSVGDGAAALRILEQATNGSALEGVDLVIMDVNMPEMDGFEATRRIRQCDAWRGLPVIIVTASAEEDTLEPAFEAGASDFITKPISYTAMRIRVQAALKLREQTLQRIEREKELQASEARLRTILSSIQAGVIILDREDHAILDVNPMAANLIGLPRGQIVGKKCHNFICSQEEGKCPFDAADYVVCNVECDLITAQNELMPILKTAAPINLGGRECILESFVDITPQKRAEETLREALAELEVLFDNSLVGIIYTRNRIFVRMNDRAAEIFGYTKEEILGVSSSLIYFKQDQFLEFGRNHVEAIQRDGIFCGEWTFRKKNGSAVAARLYAKPIDKDHLSHGVIWTVDDITDYRKTLEELKRSEMQYRLLVENTQTLILTMSPDGTVTFLNEFAESFFGCSSEEAAGNSVEELFSRKGARNPGKYLRELAEGILASASEYYQTESEHVRNDGSRSWVLWSNKALRNSDGVLSEILSVGIDITNRKKIEKALAESHYFLQNIIDSLPLPIYFQSPEKRLKLVNNAFEFMAGATKDELLDSSLTSIFPDDADGVILNMDNALLRGKADTMLQQETSLRYPDGSLRQVIFNKAFIRDSSGRLSGQVGAVMDITDRKRMEEELREMATTDGLTKLTNWRHFMELARRELDRARRYQVPVSLLMLDVDRFKSVNDRFGHDAGDKALTALADIGRESLRDVDVFARIGGEEFSVLLPETDLNGAMEAAERLRLAVEQTAISTDQAKLYLTISVGVAQADMQKPDLDTLMKQADTSLYKAKENGRNRVEGP